jgi:hypothetical protein
MSHAMKRPAGTTIEPRAASVARVSGASFRTARASRNPVIRRTMKTT